MSSYEYHEFRAIDRPLTQEEQDEVASLSSRAVVSHRKAAFEYHYSSFPGDPDDLLSDCFDAMFYIASWGQMKLVLSLPKNHFDPDRAKYYLVDEVGESTDSGVQLRDVGDRVLLSLGLEYLETGWIEGEGWIDPLLPLREDLLTGDDRPLYLFWAAVFENGLISDLDEEGNEIEIREPPVPPGMGELTEAQRAFAYSFGVTDGLLAAVAKKSPPKIHGTEVHLSRVIDSLSPKECRALLLRVTRGEHVAVCRDLNSLARSTSIEEPSASTGRTLGKLAQAAKEESQEIESREHTARLDKLEADQEKYWKEIEKRLSSKTVRYQKPVDLLCELHFLAKERGGIEQFKKRMKALPKYNKSQAFMKYLNKEGLLD